MKPFKTIMLLAAMLLLANTLPAQVDYLKQAHQYLDEGNCDGAQTYYDLYRNNHPADRDLEIAIAVCQAQKEQTERYTRWWLPTNKDYKSYAPPIRPNMRA